MTNTLPITEVLLAQSPAAEGVNSCADHFSRSLSRTELQISIDQGVPVRASAISIGCEAARILQKGQVGRVLAVFARSVYVQCEQGVFCVGVASLGRGPLQVLLASEWDSLPFEVSSGVSINLKSNWLQSVGYTVPNRCCPTEENDTVLYSGRVLGKASDPLSFRREQEALNLIVPPQQHGFAWIPGSSDWQSQTNPSFASSAGTSAVDLGLRRQCLPALKCLYRWVKSARDTPVEDVQKSISLVPALLGAGPGLTPSGDDLLAGVFLALHRLQRADLADSLWQVLEPHLEQRTNSISAAHLRMAALGQCSESVLSLLECVFSGSGCHQSDDVQASATNIQSQANRIGASSGWDTLAGMSLVLRTL